MRGSLSNRIYAKPVSFFSLYCLHIAMSLCTPLQPAARIVADVKLEARAHFHTLVCAVQTKWGPTHKEKCSIVLLVLKRLHSQNYSFYSIKKYPAGSVEFHQHGRLKICYCDFYPYSPLRLSILMFIVWFSSYCYTIQFMQDLISFIEMVSSVIWMLCKTV